MNSVHVLILFFHILPSSPSTLSGFLEKISYVFFICCVCATCLADLILNFIAFISDLQHRLWGVLLFNFFLIFSLLQSTIFHSKSFFFGHSQSVCLSLRVRQQKCEYCKDETKHDIFLSYFLCTPYLMVVL